MIDEHGTEIPNDYIRPGTPREFQVNSKRKARAAAKAAEAVEEVEDLPRKRSRTVVLTEKAKANQAVKTTRKTTAKGSNVRTRGT